MAGDVPGAKVSGGTCMRDVVAVTADVGVLCSGPLGMVVAPLGGVVEGDHRKFEFMCSIDCVIDG